MCCRVCRPYWEKASALRESSAMTGHLERLAQVAQATMATHIPPKNEDAKRRRMPQRGALQWIQDNPEHGILPLPADRHHLYSSMINPAYCSTCKMHISLNALTQSGSVSQHCRTKQHKKGLMAAMGREVSTQQDGPCDSDACDGPQTSECKGCVQKFPWDRKGIPNSI